MGCCCLQITQQFSSELESRFMHDQLAILSPLFMSLSAASPIFKGIFFFDCTIIIIIIILLIVK